MTKIKDKKKVVSLRMNRNLIDSIKKIAEKENRNFSNMVETLIMKGITQN